MNLYSETPRLIFLTQNKDPFFAYLTRKIFSEIDTNKKGRLLDLGCGSGRNIFEAAKRGMEAIGVDYVAKAINLANNMAKKEGLKKVRFITADLLSLNPRQFGLFDYIILMEVIEHIKDYQKVINFTYNSLKKGGMLLLTTPNDPRQWTILDDYAGHVRRFTIPELRQALASFKKVKIYTVGFPLHRLTFMAYNMMMRSQKKTHEPNLFRNNKLVTRIYYWVGSVVLTFDNLFASTPWGTTIVAIARK